VEVGVDLASDKLVGEESPLSFLPVSTLRSCGSALGTRVPRCQCLPTKAMGVSVATSFPRS
jgi:hypothetical protein